MSEKSTDTKERILMTVLRLFALHGYEKVSMRTIAAEVGIKAASIYNHFSNKEAMLDACYDFYLTHRFDARLTKEQYEPILRNGTKEEIFDAINYPFPEDILMQLYYAYTIVYSRLHSDDRSKDIFMDDVHSAIVYLDEYFKTAIEIGRVQEFNINAVSVLCISTRMFAGQMSYLSPHNFNHEIKNASRLADREVLFELIKMIPFNY